MPFIVRYHFSSPDNSSKYFLAYEIFKNDFTDRWLQALQQELNSKKLIRKGAFYGSRFVKEAPLRFEMQTYINVINSHSTNNGHG